LTEDEEAWQRVEEKWIRALFGWKPKELKETNQQSKTTTTPGGPKWVLDADPY